MRNGRQVNETKVSNKVKGKLESSSVAIETDDYVETTNVVNWTSQRIRRRPKIFTQKSHENKVDCLCQREDAEWYLVCNVQQDECYKYYHPKCVGLSFLKKPKSKEITTVTVMTESHTCALYV